MADSVSGTQDAATRTETSLLRPFALAYGTSLLMVLADLADGRRFHADVDDQLRELQIRFLASAEGHWYDLTLPFVTTPDPYVSPWSRLVDLPYMLLAKGFALAMPLDRALHLSFWIWPLVMLALFSLLSVATALRLARGMRLSSSVPALAPVLMAVFMAIAVLEFVPGRIDHHNVQILTLFLMAYGAVRWDGRGGACIGIGSALSVIVGLECLPLVVVAYGWLVGAFALRLRGARAVLLGAALGMAGTTVPGALAFLGVPGLFFTQCDAFSAPYIVLMLGLSAVLAASARFMPETFRAVPRLLALGIPALGLVALCAIAFPTCLAGPYSMIDPLSKAYWFDRISQEHGVLYFYGNGQFGPVILLALLAFALLAGIPAALAGLRAGMGSSMLVYAIGAAAFVLTMMLMRYIRFPAALVPLFVPAALTWAQEAANRRRVRRVFVGAGAACIGVFGGLAVVVPPFAFDFDVVDSMTFDECEGADFSVLGAVTPGRIAAPNGLGLPILLAAPKGFSVAAIPFHRASAGMKRMYEAFLSSDPAVRKAALAPFDYVAVCRFPLQSDPAFAPLYAALSAGRDWPGLIRIPPPAETRFQLFRIDHAVFR